MRFLQALGIPLTPRGRLAVDEYLRLPSHPEVYALGDCAAVGEPPVPATAQVWYYVRANLHEDAESQFAWVRDIAEAAAKMTRTKVAVQIDTDCHEVVPNLPLSQVVLPVALNSLPNL